MDTIRELFDLATRVANGWVHARPCLNVEGVPMAGRCELYIKSVGGGPALEASLVLTDKEAEDTVVLEHHEMLDEEATVVRVVAPGEVTEDMAFSYGNYVLATLK